MFLSQQTTCAALVFEDEDSGRRVQMNSLQAEELVAGN